MLNIFKMIEFKISGMPYTPTILFFLGENKEVMPHLEKKYKYLPFEGDPEMDWIKGGAFSFIRNKRFYTPCIWIEYYNSPIIAHELLHLTFKILNRAGINYCKDSEEAFTYYQQYLFDQIIDKYNKLFPEEEID